MLVLWFRRHTQADWGAIKYLTLSTVVLLEVLFIFSSKAPASHTLYVLFPVAALYGFYCWNDFLAQRRWRVLAISVLVCGVVFHVGLAIHNYSHVSLYLNRDTVQQAISERDPAILGQRRPESWY